MLLGLMDMETFLASLILLILTTSPVHTANTCGVAPNGDYVCLYRTPSISHTAAKSTCEAMQQHLVEILDQPMQDFIVSNILDSGMDSSSVHWIGLSLDMSVYKWDLSGTDLSFNNWGPSAVQTSECVGMVGSDGTWQDIICVASLHGYICQKEGTVTTQSSNVQTTTEEKTTTLTTSPPTTTQRRTTSVLSTTVLNHDFTTTKELTTNKKPTTIGTTTFTSPVSTTTLKRTTTESPTTAGDETTKENRPTTLQETTLTSFTPSTTKQLQTTSYKITTATTKTGNDSPTVKHTSGKFTSFTGNSLTSNVFGEITTFAAAKTTKELITSKETLERRTDTKLTTFTPPARSNSTFTAVTSLERSTEETTVFETTVFETTAEPTIKRTTTNPEITGTNTLSSMLGTTLVSTFKTILPLVSSITWTTKETATQIKSSTAISAVIDYSTSIGTKSSTDENTKEANPTTAKTTRFLNTSPRETTSLAPSTAPPTSSGFEGTSTGGYPPMIQQDKTFSQEPPIETTSQTDVKISSTGESNLSSTNGETTTQANYHTLSSVSDIKELSTGACNGHCELTLEERLANATLDDVSDIVENEDLGSEDILQIQGWFEDNAYIREDEENYLRYTRTYLNTFNEILTSSKEGTFDLANPAVFAESCNELLEDFAGKWSFNVTLEIAFSNIETELVRNSADAFEGFTSDFNTAQSEGQLDGYISIKNDWVEDYNTTDNSTIDIIVVTYKASMVESLGNDETNEIISNFVSITVVLDGETISLPVIFGLELDKEKRKTDAKGAKVNLDPFCVFWEYSLENDDAGYWSTFGCAVISQNATYVQCSCNHTTNFAILMQTTEVEISPEDEAALSLLSLIGLGISTAALLVTIIVLVCLPSLKSDRVFIHKHLVVALIIAQTLFISTLGAVHQELICKLVAIFLHYFYLAVFMWMLIEGVHLYLEIVQVFSRFDGKNKTIHYIVAGWGLPLLVVGVSVAIRWRNYGIGNGRILSNCDCISGHENFSDFVIPTGEDLFLLTSRCWLSIADGLIWAFLAPVAFVIAVNFIILLMVIRVVFRASSARGKDDSEYKHLVAALKGALFLLPLLGLTWAVGFMSVNEGTLAFQYLFVILNSLQGLFIFLFYCAMNKEVRTALSRKFSQVALESGGSKSLSLRAVAKLRSSGKSTSPVFRFTESSGASGLPSKSSCIHSEDDGKKESISASGISVHHTDPDDQPILRNIEPSKSPFSPDYN